METWLILRAMFFQPLPKIFSQFAITSLPADRKYIIPVQGQWRKWSEQKILQRLNHHWIRLQAANQLSRIMQTTASMPIRVKSLSYPLSFYGRYFQPVPDRKIVEAYQE